MKPFGLLLLAVALLAGALSGSSALASAAASRPPIDWHDLVFIALGTLIGLPAVLGFQVMLGNINAMRLGWLFFLCAAAYCTAAGLAVLVIAWRGPGLRPHAFLFLVVGVAMLGGVSLVRVAFRRRFAPR